MNSSIGKKNLDTDVHISQIHQAKINRFAIANGWLEELKSELKVKQNLLKNLEDAEGDAMLLDDNEEPLRILVGENCFIHFNQEDGMERIGQLQQETKDGIESVQKRMEEIRGELNKLKTELYAEFGRDAINLEAEEDEDETT